MSTLVSIITVVYNSVETLEQTILSVINQTYNNIEYVIIDGGSTDGTIDIIKKYEDKIAYWVSESDNGIYDAMNKGISKVSGELIGIINSDDWYEQDAVQTMVSAFANNDADILHGNIRLISNEESKVRPPILNLKELYKGMVLWHPTFFVKKDIYSKYGLFNTHNIVASDYEFTLNCYLNNLKFYYLDKVIVNFRLGGVSDVHILTGFAECRKIAIKYGLPKMYVNFFYIRKIIGIYIRKIIKI